MVIKESGIVEIYTKYTDRFSVGRVFCQNDNDVVITIQMMDSQEPETGYVKSMTSDKIEFSCLDVSNAQWWEDITVFIRDIICIEFESIDNQLLQYANRNQNI